MKQEASQNRALVKIHKNTFLGVLILNNDLLKKILLNFFGVFGVFGTVYGWMNGSTDGRTDG